MSLTAQEVRWVAHLARLELTDAELATMTRQLAAIVEYVDLLKQVNTDGVEPLAHALTVHNVFRDDEPAPSLPVAAALANAPDRRTNARGEQFYGVPAVLDS
jgi:aspartyl-tRNA(Asn)/glutamyl-tRNA(Gln) amidotransferase subunit C